MKIVTVLGNRTHFIKHSLLSKALRQEYEEVIVHTGQHYDPNMSGDFFKEMELPEPHYNLNVLGGHPYYQIGEMVSMIGNVLLHEKPDMVLVHGDTSSSLAGALASSKLHIPLVHAEAGCRCWDRSIPEEVNRVLIDEMSQLLLCPTVQCVENLTNMTDEDDFKQVEFTGDVLYDTYLRFRGSVNDRRRLSDIVVTVHREDNTDNPENLSQVIEAVIALGKDREVIFPVHPRTEKKIGRDQWDRMNEVMDAIEPVGHADMLSLIAGAKIVITDSGGVQREAYFAGKPCVYIGTAGWRELVLSGSSIVVPARAEAIIRAVEEFTEPKFPEGIFGDGTAVKKAVEYIKKWQETGQKRAVVTL